MAEQVPAVVDNVAVIQALDGQAPQEDQPVRLDKMTLWLTKFRLSVPFSPQNRLPKWWVFFCSLYSFPFYHTSPYYEFVTVCG